MAAFCFADIQIRGLILFWLSNNDNIIRSQHSPGLQRLLRQKIGLSCKLRGQRQGIRLEVDQERNLLCLRLPDSDFQIGRFLYRGATPDSLSI